MARSDEPKWKRIVASVKAGSVVDGGARGPVAVCAKDPPHGLVVRMLTKEDGILNEILLQAAQLGQGWTLLLVELLEIVATGGEFCADAVELGCLLVRRVLLSCSFENKANVGPKILVQVRKFLAARDERLFHLLREVRILGTIE